VTQFAAGPFAKRTRAQQAAAVVGVDAGKFEHTLVVRPRGAADRPPFSFPTTRAGYDRAAEVILAAAGGAPPTDILVGIEFAGVYGFTLAHYLRDRGFAIQSVLPAHTKRWKLVQHNQPLKTDAKDAAVICDLAAQGRYVSFPFLQQEYAELRYLTSRRERLTVLRNGAISRLRSALQIVFPELETIFGDLSKPTARALLATYPGPQELLAAPRAKVKQLLREASRNHGVDETYAALITAAQTTLALPGAQGAQRDEIPLLVAQLELAQQQMKLTEQRMAVALQALPEAPALLSIPRVGLPTAAAFLGAIGDPRAYHSAREILKLAGLSLVEHSSGTVRGRRRLSKSGRPDLRRMAYMLAVGSVHTGQGRHAPGLFRPEYEALLARNGGRKIPALVAVARSALKLMYSIARDRRMFTPEPPARGQAV
jgi:transposase